MTPIDWRPGYHATENGRIWSDRSGRFLKGCRSGRGYTTIHFAPGDSEYIHRMVCRVFHGPAPQGKPEVRHLDGNMHNNAASNLTWGSRAENEADKFAHGTTPKGERNPMARLTVKTVEEMRQRRKVTGQSFARIAAEFGVSTMTAHRAITGVSWR